MVVLVVLLEGDWTSARRHRKRNREHSRHQSHSSKANATAAFMMLKGIPLLDQPDLSFGKQKQTTDAIRGSKNAFVVTKKQYLRKEWCKTEPLKQMVREPGCISRQIVNRFCYGQCSSFFIPKSDKRDSGIAAFTACGFCKPKRFSSIRVTLQCPHRQQKFKRKKIQRIKQCTCVEQKIDLT